MKLVGCMPVRNEAYILGLTLRAALLWCDAVVVLMHACTDGSSAILGKVSLEHPGRVSELCVESESWDEMRHRQRMLEAARAEGATHIAIVDADEILSGNLLSEFGPERTPDVHFHGPSNMIQLPGYNLRGGLHTYHSNGIWGRRWFSTAFADNPTLYWAANGYDHHHREPRGIPLQPYRPIQQGQGGILHLWGVSERRLRAHHAWYKCMETLKYPNKSRTEIDNMYSWAIHGRQPHDTPAQWTFEQVPEEWWAPYAHLMKYLDVDAEPWQEAEVRRLVEQHGPARFAGLDLFGIA